MDTTYRMNKNNKVVLSFTFPPVGNKSFRSSIYILANTYYGQSF